MSRRPRSDRTPSASRGPSPADFGRRAPYGGEIDRYVETTPVDIGPLNLDSWIDEWNVTVRRLQNEAGDRLAETIRTRPPGTPIDVAAYAIYTHLPRNIVRLSVHENPYTMATEINFSVAHETLRMAPEQHRLINEIQNMNLSDQILAFHYLLTGERVVSAAVAYTVQGSVDPWTTAQRLDELSPLVNAETREATSAPPPRPTPEPPRPDLRKRRNRHLGLD